jgi:hypothetical protein
LSEPYAAIESSLEVREDSLSRIVVSVTGVVGAQGKKRDIDRDIWSGGTLEPKETTY